MGVKHMAEIRQDMLPDESETNQDVSEDVKTPEQAPVKEDKPEPEVQDKSPNPAPKGSQTPDNRAHAAFLEERQLRKDAEKRALELERQLKEKELSSVLSELDDSELSEEGKMLKQQLAETNKKLSLLEGEREKERVYAKFPQLSKSKDEFESFKDSRPSLSVEDAAKIFMADNDLINPPKSRKGLEKGSSGGRQAPQSSGLTMEEVENLRVNQPKRYSKMLTEGAFDHLIN